MAAHTRQSEKEMENSVNVKTQSYKALDLLWSVWKTQGVYMVDKYRFRHILHIVLILCGINLLNTIMFVGEWMVVENLHDLLNNMAMGLCLIICDYKTCIVLITRRRLLEIRPILDKLSARPKIDSQQHRLDQINKFFYRFTWIVFLCYFVNSALYTFRSVLSHGQELTYPIWTPYDWKASPLVYWMTFSYQNFAQFIFCVQQAVNDAIGPVYLSILNTHLQFIMERVKKIGTDPEKSDDDNCREFIESVEDHKRIVRIFNILQGTLSYTLFLQILATVFIFCAVILKHFLYPLTMSELFTSVVFPLAEMLEVAPCCYFSNEIMVSTDQFVSAIYSSNWTGLSPRFKKMMIIFMSMTQKCKVIIAGKFVPVTMRTLAWIIKMSYSLFTVACNFSQK